MTDEERLREILTDLQTTAYVCGYQDTIVFGEAPITDVNKALKEILDLLEKELGVIMVDGDLYTPVRRW